jgi:uncharacterized protein (DUF736 family)
MGAKFKNRKEVIIMALKRVGALWQKIDKKGDEFFSGSLDMGVMGEARVMVFKNEKAEENHPDMVVSLIVGDKEDK